MVEEQTIHFLVVVRATPALSTLDFSTSFVAMGTTAIAIQLPPPIVN
jgi:hypothetical protein